MRWFVLFACLILAVAAAPSNDKPDALNSNQPINLDDAEDPEQDKLEAQLNGINNSNTDQPDQSNSQTSNEDNNNQEAGQDGDSNDAQDSDSQSNDDQASSNDSQGEQSAINGDADEESGEDQQQPENGEDSE